MYSIKVNIAIYMYYDSMFGFNLPLNIKLYFMIYICCQFDICCGLTVNYHCSFV